MDVKALQDDLQSLGFTPNLAKSEMEKKVGKQKLGNIPAHMMKE